MVGWKVSSEAEAQYYAGNNNNKYSFIPSLLIVC